VLILKPLPLVIDAVAGPSLIRFNCKPTTEDAEMLVK